MLKKSSWHWVLNTYISLLMFSIGWLPMFFFPNILFIYYYPFQDYWIIINFVKFCLIWYGMDGPMLCREPPFHSAGVNCAHWRWKSIHNLWESTIKQDQTLDINGAIAWDNSDSSIFCTNGPPNQTNQWNIVFDIQGPFKV